MRIDTLAPSNWLKYADRLENLIDRIKHLWPPTYTNVMHVVDILLVTFLVFKFLQIVRNTRAWRIFIGILIFVILLNLSDALGFKTLHWLLEKATLLGPVALVILFLPELRQALEGFGKLGTLSDRSFGRDPGMTIRSIEAICQAVSEFSRQKVGSLLVIERSVHLDDIANSGVKMDSEISCQLLSSIFYDQNPLHDGAVLVRAGRIVAAACRLPLSENTRLDTHLHMRHRAGVGISEQSDCLCVIVSEERGSISVAKDGGIIRLADSDALKAFLSKNLTKNQVAEPEPSTAGPDEPEVA